MQYAKPLECSTDLQDELEERIGLDFCTHDQDWLDYCRLGGHEHYEFPVAERPKKGYARAA
ncbi:hypothetical protein [Azorhizophilus paspali]|uniref:Uncharacterized protein n=1 Tax=Azorhizophilus paspali TaxID=69963 RepID=A0ABV6SUU5_AZOPA